MLESYHRIYYNKNTKKFSFKIIGNNIKNFKTNRNLISEIFKKFTTKNFSLIKFSRFKSFTPFNI